MELYMSTPSTLYETFAFRIRITRAMVEAKLTQGDFWYPPTAPVSFDHGLLADVPNRFQLKFLPEMTGVELYHSEILASVNEYQIHVKRILLTILKDGIPEAQGCFYNRSKQSAPETFMSPTGEQYKNRLLVNILEYQTRATLFKDKWSFSANELKVEIIISKTMEAKYLPFQVQEFNCIPDSPNKKRRLFDHSKYFLSTELSDVSIRCQTESFPAHVLILSASSPVFDKMFLSEMKESQEKLVEIEDASPQDVREMLRYFYTGEVENLLDVAPGLAVLADKYMIDTLKNYCEQHLLQSVKKENALEMFCFGLLHQMPNLAEKAEPIVISKKSELVKNNADLQNLLQKFPPFVADELFKLFVHKN